MTETINKCSMVLRHCSTWTALGQTWELFCRDWDTAHNLIVHKLDTATWNAMGSPDPMLITIEPVPEDYGE